jgi:carboxypeptidase C (cathepsin A)
MTLGGKTLKYTATAGTLLIRDEEDKPYGSIFYVAYTLDGADASTRPVSFLYNGGPGSATLWLHMGSFSPVRVRTDSPNATAGPPFKLVPNEYSLLDKTDLVFIDAPLTGYSRAVGKGHGQGFQRRRSRTCAPSTASSSPLSDREPALELAQVSHRRVVWNHALGGAGRHAGQRRRAVERRGADLVDPELQHPRRRLRHASTSSTCPATRRLRGTSTRFPTSRPTGRWVQQAREFASGPYAQALFAGHNLPAAQLDEVAKEVSRLTGLSVDYVKEANLRISPTRFRKEVLRDDRRTLGRYDMRFEGVDVDAAGENPSYDASDTGITGAFVAALHDYLSGS